jgi:hypothetical protein
MAPCFAATDSLTPIRDISEEIEHLAQSGALLNVGRVPEYHRVKTRLSVTADVEFQVT